MTDQRFRLRAAQSGSLISGTPGNVLTFQEDGTLQGEPPSGGGPLLVASFFGDVADTSLEPAINGVFYTVPVDGAGWYRLSAILRPAAITTDVSLEPILGYVGPAATEVSPIFQFRASSEGGLAQTLLTPADFYLADGETLSLGSPQALNVIVGVRLELVALLAP